MLLIHLLLLLLLLLNWCLYIYEKDCFDTRKLSDSNAFHAHALMYPTVYLS